jgi:hypothetical protein
MTSARLAPPGGHDGSLGITDEEFDHDRAGVLAWLRAEGDLDFGPAVLDPAHIGDIRGSLGTISLRDRAPRRTWRRRLVTFAAILGPGIIVMTGDNDAGGVQTYTQAGQQYGNSMMWVLLALFVVLFAAQEMVTRLGAVTGVGQLLTEVLFAAAGGAVLVIGGPLLLRSRKRRIAAGGSADRLADIRDLDRHTWRMPPLDQLPKPVMSPLRTAGLLLLRGYLIASVLLITVKIFSSFIH